MARSSCRGPLSQLQSDDGMTAAARTAMGWDGRAGMPLSLFISPGALPVSNHLHFLTRWSPGSCSSYMVSQGFKCKRGKKVEITSPCISLSQKHRGTLIPFHWFQISHKSSQTQVQIYLNKARANFKNIWTGIYLGIIFRQYNPPWSPVHKQVGEKQLQAVIPMIHPLEDTRELLHSSI